MEQPLSLFTLPWYIFVRFASPVAAAAAAARSVFELDQLALRSLLRVSYLQAPSNPKYDPEEPRICVASA